MIFTNTVNGVDKEMLFHSLPILGIAFFMYICLFGLSFLSGKILHLQGDHQQLYSAMSALEILDLWEFQLSQVSFRKRNAVYLGIYHDRPADAVDSRGKANFEDSGYSGNYLKNSSQCGKMLVP